MFLTVFTMSDPSNLTLTAELPPASDWVRRWSRLLAPHSSVLDIACGQGRHMKWFADQGHGVTGIDISPVATQAAAAFGKTVLADIENDPWPLMDELQARQFDAVLVTNYLWRPLFPRIADCLAPGGVLIYETFAQGQEKLGKPSRPDFLLTRGELLVAFGDLRLVAFEEGFLDGPPRCVQRIAAVKQCSSDEGGPTQGHYPL